ncbi:MAG: amidohydrolase [Deltaproteobacteria bacterium]|nr:amidohydrolase [Deltaproteobacteria bacterium]MBW2051602.1 amidohydrolase [Deltaproteobacteria bacterium]MBW2322924.1 amidohydrolase [Deltaproteobacteria bacterium]
MTDLLLVNANVVTMDPARPRARELAVKGGRILAVGEEGALQYLKERQTQVIDLGGKTILPGFIDAHLHLRGLAESLITLKIGPADGVRSIADIQEKIRRESQKLPPGTWIRAGGYNEVYLAEKRHPNRTDLDAAAPRHPVKLTHRSGHAHVLNSLSLGLIKVSKETSEPLEGIIERDLEAGEPTGLFFGLGDFLSKLIPPIEEARLDDGVKLANQELLSCGITSVQDASSRNDYSRFQQMRRWKADGFLKGRVVMMLGLTGLEELLSGKFSFSELEIENHLRPGGVKIILDETTGQLNPAQQELNQIVLSIHQAGLQAGIHAIEETAIESALTALRNALQIYPRPDHRHRIEHCSVCPPNLVDQIASLGVMAVTHPAFIYYSGERYLKTVPPSQLEYLYPMGTLLNGGVPIAAGSDAPIVPVNPLPGIYAAVSRKAENGDDVLTNEKVTVYEALRMYTALAAMSAFEEKDKGALSPGRLADVVVLSDNPAAVPEEEITGIQVEMTILGGEIAWTR